nr:hypothetical protein [Tanacetum cinerariifolium]
MSTIIAQQTKLDLELVPKESRLDIEKCNGRIPRILTPREPTFQVVLDAIALTPCYPAFIITTNVLEVYMYQFWNSVYKYDTFYRFKLGLCGKTSGFDKLRLSRAQILWGMYYQKNVDYVELLWKDFIYQIENRRNKIGMHTSKDDYWISTLRFISANESTQIYGAILPECLTSLAMKESKAYKTYFVYATGAVPPKIARKFKKTSPSKKDSDLVPVDKEPVTKGKRVKRSIKKSSTKPAIALTEEAQMKEVRKKSLRDFYKLHSSGSGTVSKEPPRVDKITPPVISEGTGDKPGVPDVTKDESTESESVSWGNDEDDSNDENDSENEGNDDENKKYEEEVKDDDDEDDDDDKSEGDEDRGMDDTTNQFSDDVQDKKADDEMMDAQPEKENLKITQEQVVKDAHVMITTVIKEFEVPDTSISHSSDLASKFLKFSDIHPNDA